MFGNLSDRSKNTKPNGAGQQQHLEYLPNPQASLLHRSQRWLEDRLKRGEREVFSESIELTPELASLLLTLNTANRTLKDSVVSRYATDIGEGRFAFNGEPLIVCKNRVLGDGQHRSHAVIRAGRSIHTMITFGIDQSTMTTMDGGVARTAGDYLHMESYVDANAFAATAGKLLQIESKGKVYSGTEAPTKQQVLDFARNHPDIVESLRIVGSGKPVGSKSTLSAAHYLMAQKDRNAADYFIQRLIDGTELTKNDPIYVLREKLMSKDKRLNVNEQLKAIAMAWNNWRANRQVRTVTHAVKKGVKLPEFQ